MVDIKEYIFKLYVNDDLDSKQKIIIIINKCDFAKGDRIRWFSYGRAACVQQSGRAWVLARKRTERAQVVA